MTVRHRALGRTRGAFTATTLYIRGDVVRNAGALYAAKETFTSGASFVLANWDEVIPAPVIPASVSVTGLARNTVGPGLPAFSGRFPGDQHYDTTAKKEYILTGLAGNRVADLFEYTTVGESSLVGATSSSGHVWAGAGIKTHVNGSQLQLQNTNDGTAGLAAYLPVTLVGEIEGSVTFPWPPGFSASNGIGLTLADVNGGNAYKFEVDQAQRLQVSKNGSALLFATLPRIPANNEVVTISFKKTTSAIFVYLNGVQFGTTAHADNTTFGRGGLTANSNFLASPLLINEFEIYATGTLAWENANQDVAAHTHAGRVGTAPVVTHGAGLPTLAGRAVNDLHLDTTTGRAAQVTGVYGTGDVADTFTTPATGSVGGRVTEVGAKTLSLSGTLPVSGGEAGPGSGLWGFAASGGNFDYEVKHRNTGGNFITVNMAGNATTIDGVGASSGYRVGFSNDDITLYRNGTQVATVSGTAIGYARFTTYTYRLKRTGQTIEVYSQGVLRLTYTDTTPLTGTFFWIQGGSDSYYDNLNFSDIGSAAWDSTEPIYIQAQLATGNVAVGTHVLKPGLRVPSASTLKEFVLRADTAPTGAAITVQVERFNGGVSQGIIATASIPAGEFVGSVVGLSQACAKGDILRFNITSVGSTVAGADLTASLDLR